jgi:predicted nucleotidyltransferase
MGFRLFKRARRAPEENLSAFSERAQQALGPRVKTIAAFGSSTSGEYHPSCSDLNVLVVVDQINFAALADLTPVLKDWRRREQTEPVLLSKAELPIYVQALPIEFLDIKDHHRILFGENPFPELQVSTENLRAQCLQELSLKLLKLRLALAATMKNKKAMRALLAQSSSSFLSLFRAALRLDGEIPAATKLKAGQRLAEKLGFDPSDLEKIYELHFRRENDSLEELAGRYLLLIEKTLRHIARRSHGT